MVESLDYAKLWGGLDSRFGYQEEQDSPNMLFFSELKNITIDTGLIKRVNGDLALLSTGTGSKIVGISTFEVENTQYLVFNSNGKFNIFNGNDSYTTKKSGLDIFAPCTYAQFVQRIFVTNGVDEIFGYDPLTDSLVVTNFSAQQSRPMVGQFCVSFANRLWVAQGTAIYYSDLGNPTEWRNIPGSQIFGGVIDNFMGNTDTITGLFNFGAYVGIQTTTHIYMLAGTDQTNFTITTYGTTGMPSTNGTCMHNRNLYFYNNQNTGVYFIGQLTDIGQFKISDAVTRRVYPTLLSTVDTNRLSEIYMVANIEHNQMWLYVPEFGKQDLSACYVFDFNYATPNTAFPDFIGIYPRIGSPVTCACSYKNKVFTGTSDGQILQQDIGDTFRGNRIPFDITTPFLSLGTRSTLKRTEFIKLWMNNRIVNNFDFTIRFNRNLTKSHTKKITIAGSGNWGEDSSIWGITSWADDSEISKLVSLGKEFYSMQFGFHGNTLVDLNQNIALRAFSLMEYQQLNDY